MSTPTLDIRNLTLGFKGYTGFTEVLHGISLSVEPGERVALVGESGSGKSVTARIVLGLLQELRTARIGGSVLFEGRELDGLNKRERHALRGKAMSMIFQDPTSSLNPVFRISDQFHDVLRRADPRITRDAALERAAAILAEVSVRDAERVLNAFPFQLSGGLNQRVMIAMALANEPALLIADEPGTALDVTVQAQTLQLMRKLVEEHHTAVLFISHNLGVVREFADRVYVIYKGRIVEQGPTRAVFEGPRHPYTRALMAAVPRLTGGGIPDIDEDSPDFGAPLETHDAEGRA
ncbi:ABC transporter ATP-binding protein [Hoeflea alexandrii]|uniref:ATP-binding cassette domain-containing protein n=1 Tax=Hoeflea alexandrii TaxID=288436 RepID=A0ABT1CKN1_9HYPH|nr:ABC transporter ATP-binding protein [Hoeflea alexandrii]MCO6406759.1 ATP-binding cassette domain-containing protein [Hoeflea alexandrii]MCY0154770.1 ABC transporter ATP-binding protein [Hoeflea alexandrii]